MRIKIMLCIIVLLLSCSSLPGYAQDNSPIDQKTMDRLRETYELEVPETPSRLETWSRGDLGISLDPPLIADIVQGTLFPLWFLVRQILCR